ncbi:Thioesterase/thiol ester dehydrase-isomerase [Dacryopinax primogenitus]|uniref:Thioesterase/thiol ester dehydrase-isomerase n=1 Tax=Dacryopinax primogenitus (strain DJM 731) TaxID=1858805 RepID=M5G7H4_DACPD|nr:Thioesterase/thiol ester dehydrase-isomerase [Dacryopinax primogenitus]EJU01817.1 Thioesterase/thiol ester dehydrase-isomerase [Dacryopinax primogenitus]
MRSPQPWLETLLPRRPPQTGQTEGDKTVESPKPKTELPPRRMHDSYVELVLPFLSQASLLEQYTNVAGGIRNGKLMEHLDSLAGSAAYKHILGPSTEDITMSSTDFYLVTAAVERMDLLHYIQQGDIHDLRLSGNVIYTGKSSIEVTVQMVGLPRSSHEREMPIMVGRFTMVCRDAFTHKAREVNQLVLGTPEEWALNALGKSHAELRKTTQALSLSRVPPSQAEAQVVHDMFLSRHPQGGEEFLSSTFVPARTQRTHLPSGGKDEYGNDIEWVWMEDTALESCQVMFPQDRNVHGKVFGGYLMKLAYELAFATASQHTQKRTLGFLCLDSIAFKLPVPVGAILKLKSGIGYSDSRVVHIGVRANVLDVNTGEEKTTNEFWFTWDANGLGTKGVVPRTYEEAMTWLESRRRLALGAEIRAIRQGSIEFQRLQHA